MDLSGNHDPTKTAGNRSDALAVSWYFEDTLGLEGTHVVPPQTLLSTAATVLSKGEIENREIQTGPQFQEFLTGWHAVLRDHGSPYGNASRDEFAAKYEELTGSGNLITGTVARAVRNYERRAPYEEWQKFSYNIANMLLMDRSFMTQLAGRLAPTVSIDASAGLIRFDGQRFPVNLALGMVIEYGPGLVGLSRISEQLRSLADKGARPKMSQYLGISNTPFVTKFLASAALRATDGALGPPTFMCREDGIVGTGRYLTEEMGLRSISSLIICSGVQTAAAEELADGIQNAHFLLSRGGVLVVRSISDVKPGETSIDAQLDMACTYFGEPVFQKNILTGSDIDRLHGIKHPGQVAVFVKE